MAWRKAIVIVALLAASAAPARGAAPPADDGAVSAPVFDPAAGWAEFETLLRERYAYFERPDVDGEAVLAAFRPRALAASTRDALVDVIQQAAFNFADPHLTVGPFRGAEASLVPGGSDLFAEYRDGAWRIVDVRSQSAAAAQGVRPGDTVVSIDGRSPGQAIVHVLGRDLSILSPAQARHGMNVALAGVFGARRTLVLERGGGTLDMDLPAVADQLRAAREAPRLAWERRGGLAILRINNSLGDNATITAFNAALPAHLDARAILIDLRNTPNGGNTTVARAIMGAFTACPRPYQQHAYVWETRTYGVPRQAIELVMPGRLQFRGRVYVAAGRWTGSMGEGLTIGLDALGATTVGAPMADLLGGIENVTLEQSGARIDLPVEQLLHVDGSPREDFAPRLSVDAAEARADGFDPVIDAVERDLARSRPQGEGLRWSGFKPCPPPHVR